MILSLITSNASAQEAYKKNDVYFELLGSGLIGSVNYERQLSNKPGFGMRVGLGFYPTDDQGWLSIPLGINYLIGLGKSSFIDVGAGVTLTQEPVDFLDFSGNVYDSPPYTNFIPTLGF